MVYATIFPPPPPPPQHHSRHLIIPHQAFLPFFLKTPRPHPVAPSCKDCCTTKGRSPLLPLSPYHPYHNQPIGEVQTLVAAGMKFDSWEQIRKFEPTKKGPNGPQKVGIVCMSWNPSTLEDREMLVCASHHPTTPRSFTYSEISKRPQKIHRFLTLLYPKQPFCS